MGGRGCLSVCVWACGGGGVCVVMSEREVGLVNGLCRVVGVNGRERECVNGLSIYI